MRKNLTRIASLVLACVLFSVPAFALGGRYDTSTRVFTVTGGQTDLQTSLIIVKGNHATLPVADEAVTGAIYIDQVAAGAESAAFAGVALDSNYDVHTAFFSNESENSASSAKIVTASISIDANVNEITVGDTVTFAVTGSASVEDANTVAYVNGEEYALGGTISAGKTFTPDAAGTYTVQLKSTVAGEEVSSNIETIVVEAQQVVLDPEFIEGDDTILDLVKSPTSTYAASPVGIKVTFDGEKTINRMKWVFEADGTYYYSATLPVNLTVSGAAAFAAVVKNGDVVDGNITNAIEIDKVGAIFDVNGQDFYTNEAYGGQKNPAN